jgi:hypothetical protein
MSFVFNHSPAIAMPSNAMRQLCKTVAQVLNTERFGAKLSQRDDCTLILKNYRCISMRRLDLIHEQFPQVDITVQSHVDSDAGFAVIFVLRDTASALHTSTCAQGVMLAAILVTALTYDYIGGALSMLGI